MRSRKDDESAKSVRFPDESSETEQRQQPNLLGSDTPAVPRRIYILGANIPGSFIAHSLAGIPNPPPLTLLFAQHRALRLWQNQDRALRVTTHQITEIRYGFDAQLRRQPDPDFSLGDGPTSRARKNGPSDANGGYPEANELFSKGRESRGEALEEKPSDAGSPEDAESSFEAYLDESEERNSYPNASAQPTERLSEDDATSVGDQREQREPGERNDEEIIYNLIVTVPPHRTVELLRSWAHRLTQDSTVLFLQNGLGILEEVKEEIFPDETNRPTFIVGVMTHGLYPHDVFDVRHSGQGTMALGIIPDKVPKGPTSPHVLYGTSTSSRYLMRTMTRTPVFVAVGMSPTNLLQQQLDRLVVNAIIQPIATVLDVKTGSLLSNSNISRVMRLLLAEMSQVIRSLPELQNVPNVHMRFDIPRLENLVVQVIKFQTKELTNMVLDVRHGEMTEIDYYNGYIVKRGEQMGIHCVMNYMLMQMVKGRRKMVKKEMLDELPFRGSLRGMWN